MRRSLWESLFSCSCNSYLFSALRMCLKMAELLDTFGSDLAAERYNVVLAFLAEQEILCPEDFIGLRPFREMAGVDILDQHEIEILETIAAAVQSKGARKRTSHHHEALCICCACLCAF